jgi:hypothetical protein
VDDDALPHAARRAAVGMSTDAALVHLHYQMQMAPGFSEGIPSVFGAFARKLGTQWRSIQEGPIGTGEIVRDGSRRSR